LSIIANFLDTDSDDMLTKKLDVLKRFVHGSKYMLFAQQIAEDALLHMTDIPSVGRVPCCYEFSFVRRDWVDESGMCARMFCVGVL
jgi:hypothetical protein